MHIKLTDFGSARINLISSEDSSKITSSDKLNDTSKRYSFVGTCEYCSPELLNDRLASQKSDIWAIACILFQLLTLKVPFKGANEYLTFQLILKCNVTYPDSFPSQARDLVSKILILNSDKRPTLAEIRKHSFFYGTDWDNYMDTVPPLEYSSTTNMIMRSLTSSESISNMEMKLIGSNASSGSRLLQPNDSLVSLNSFATVHYASLLKPSEIVVFYGLVVNKKLLQSKKYLLLLTTLKRLLFVDPTSTIIRKEYHSIEQEPLFKNINHFELFVSEQKFVLQTPNNNANEWVRNIKSVFNPGT